MIKEIDTIVYAGRVKDTSILMKSSSGGAFTVLSDLFLDNGDAVVSSVYNYENHTTEFRMIHTKEQRDKALGSKYMQSKPGNIFLDAYKWLKDNPKKKLLFFGMGCQADGFRRFAEMKGIREQVYIVDIICHGAPSPKLWREYAQSLEKQKGKISYLTFKDKRNGWNSPYAYALIEGEEVPLREYVNIFYSHCSMRPSCHECPYSTTERKTDITIGDFWHIEETIPDFFDRNGNSLLLIHTDRGKELFENVNDKIDYRLSDKKECWQANLERPTPISKHREKFWNDYKSKGIDFVTKKYGNISIIRRVKYKLSSMIKSIR